MAHQRYWSAPCDYGSAQEYVVIGFDRETGQTLFVTDEGALTAKFKDAAKVSEGDARAIARGPDLLQQRRVNALQACHRDRVPTGAPRE